MDPFEEIGRALINIGVQKSVESGASVGKSWIQKRREKNAQSLSDQVRSMLPLNLEQPKEVPTNLVHAIIDNGTLEDNDFLRRKYAALLANAVSPSFKHEVRPSFIEILKQLTPAEAKVLDDLYAQPPSSIDQPYRKGIVRLAGTSVGGDLALEERQLAIVVRSLDRHNVLNMVARTPTNGFSGYRTSADEVEYDEGHVQLNDFGFEFVAACRPPE